MIIITTIIIPFCFGFITGKALKNKDTVTVVLAIIGVIADLVLILII